MEFERLMAACKEHPEEDKWVVAVGPTQVVSMVNMSATKEATITTQSMEWATYLASAHRGYGALRTDEEKREWVEHRARGADQWNRGIDTSYPLVAALSAFHGLATLAHSDEPEARGKSYPTTQKFGRVVRHDEVVKGLVAMGEDFQSGSTADLVVKASRLVPMIAPVQRKGPALHLATSCKRIVTLDCRNNEPTVVETCHVRVHEVLWPKWRRAARTVTFLALWYKDYKESAYAPDGVGMKRARASFEKSAYAPSGVGMKRARNAA